MDKNKKQDLLSLYNLVLSIKDKRSFRFPICITIVIIITIGFPLFVGPEKGGKGRTAKSNHGHFGWQALILCSQAQRSMDHNDDDDVCG